jgi:hypothetical protein
LVARTYKFDVARTYTAIPLYLRYDGMLAISVTLVTECHPPCPYVDEWEGNPPCGMSGAPAFNPFTGGSSAKQVATATKPLIKMQVIFFIDVCSL